MNTQKNECCSCGCGCPALPQKHQINIDLLFLDPDICPRCRGIENVLDEAVSETEALFENSGVKVRILVNKINIASKELAISYEFENPPTIRVDGQDIDLEVPENLCALCGNLCGKDIENGLWTYLEEEYSIPPKAFIVNAILLEAYGRTPPIQKKEYIFPCNLEVFFRNKKKYGEIMNKPKVAFICVHNSCRSQIAEALGKRFASDVFESYSAGTERKDRINQDAVRLMKQIYGIDMEQTQRPKLLADIPTMEVVVTMGCNVKCPYLPSKHREDWGLDDPTGKEDSVFLEVIHAIEGKILELKRKLQNKEILD